MTKVWRIQGTSEMENHASWDGYRAVEVVEPAPDWPGYWWARGLDPWVRQTWFLIRAEDVERAEAGDEVDTFAPGLYGCDDPAELLAYITSNLGGVTDADGLYVALYEGDVFDRSEDGVVFRPVEILEIWPAAEWVRAHSEDE